MGRSVDLVRCNPLSILNDGQNYAAISMIPTGPIGSIPRPLALVKVFSSAGARSSLTENPGANAVRETVREFEETASPVIVEGDQRNYYNCVTYFVDRLRNVVPDGFALPFDAGHVKRLPFSVDLSTSRSTGFAKIRSRVLGKARARYILRKGT